MSILTKFFVVLVTVLAVVLVALVVPFVAQTEDYRTQLGSMQQRLNQAQRAAAIQANEISMLMEQERRRADAAESRARLLEQEVQNVQTTLTETQLESRKRGADLSALQVQLENVNALNAKLTEMLDLHSQELQNRREAMARLHTQVVELGARNDQLQSEADALERQVRRMQEQQVAMQERERELVQQLTQAMERLPAGELPGAVAGRDGEDPPYWYPGGVLRGAVTHVEPIGDQTLVELNIGANDGVAENMLFMLSRNNSYLGTLVAERVDRDATAARVLRLQPNVRVRAGDEVVSGTTE